MYTVQNPPINIRFSFWGRGNIKAERKWRENTDAGRSVAQTPVWRPDHFTPKTYECTEYYNYFSVKKIKEYILFVIAKESIY